MLTLVWIKMIFGLEKYMSLKNIYISKRRWSYLQLDTRMDMKGTQNKYIEFTMLQANDHAWSNSV